MSASGDRQRWDDRYSRGSHASPDAPDWLDAHDALIPRRGPALDVAAGAGRVARWLARRGLDVTAADVSPVGLGLCRQAAADEGLCIETLELDLEQAPLPAGPFVAISCFHYLQRDLFPSLRERLAPAGVLICELPTRRNLERHARPSARFLVEVGELRELCAPLELLHFEEGWVGDRALARALARRGPDG